MIERASLHTIRVAFATLLGTAIAGSGCSDPVEPELGAGFATVSGEIQTFGGEPFSGEIGISCGPETPTDFGRSYRTSGPGQYSADLLVPSRSASAWSLEATEYR